MVNFKDLKERLKAPPKAVRSSQVAKASAGGNRRSDYYSFGEGRTSFILLPFENEGGELDISSLQGRHWNLGSENRDTTYCPDVTDQEKGWGCPICAAIHVLTVNGAPEKQLKAFRGPAVRTSWYVNALILDAEDTDSDIPDDPVILRVPWTVFDPIMKSYERYGSQLWDFEGAIVLEVHKEVETKGKRKNTTYHTSTLPDRHLLFDEAADEAEAAKQVEALFNKSVDLTKKLTGRWTKDQYEKAIELGNEMFSSFGFAQADADDDEIWPPLPPELDIDSGYEDEDDENDETPQKGKLRRKPSLKKPTAARGRRRPSPSRRQMTEEEDDDQEAE